MKKIIKRFWGVGLILMLLSTLFIAATPVSAADPLNWESVVTGPSAMFKAVYAGSDVVDYATNDGNAMYAITRTYGVTAVVSTTFVSTNTTGDTYTFTYTNSQLIAARTGTVNVALNSAAGVSANLTLQTGDTGIYDVTNTNATRTIGSATAGGFAILGPGATLATFTFNGTVSDGVVNPGTNVLLQHIGFGWWSDITSRLPAGVSGNMSYLAMAPDDANVVVVGSSVPAAATLAITTNGGSSFSSMGTVQSGGANAATVIRGIAVSPVVTGGYRYIAAYGTGTGGNAPGIYYYNYGAGVGAWRNACVAATTTDFVSGPVAYTGVTTAYDNVVAFKFSPNFPSDYMATAVLDDTETGITSFHILSFNSRSWDTAIATGYPALIFDGANGGDCVVNKADIALLPDYDGGDESLRIAFVGAAIDNDGTEAGGVWRCLDYASGKIFGTVTPTAIASVAYDGTNLAAGCYATNNVYRSADPMVTSPTFLINRNLKKIGLETASFNEMVNLKFVGANLYGSMLGKASAMSKSADYGNVWNDFTLMDSALTTIDDLYYSADGNTWYIAAHDGATSAVYRLSMGMSRVLVVEYNATTVVPDFMLRGIASDASVLYAADESGTVLYYTADGGTTRWYQRSSVPAAMADLAVESKEVIYIGSSQSVYKSSNSGFTWSLPINSRLAGTNAVNSMLSLSENNLVIGGTAGGVVWTTDGGTTWFPAFGVMNTFTPVLVAATGLTAGSYVFAAEEGNNSVWRCVVGPTNPIGEFKSMNMPAQATAEVNIGLMLTNGVLYALSTDGTIAYLSRSLAPAIPSATHSGIFWGTRYSETGIGFATAIASVNALRVSAGAPGTIKLYSVGTYYGAANMYYYDDTLALGGPKLLGPADKTRVEILSPLTGSVQNVNFTWSRMSLATGYYLFIALDAGFTQPLVSPPTSVPSTLDPVSSIQSGLTNFQPGTTYYWKVAVSTPIGSGFSETRSFTVAPTAASVPTIASPANGATVTTTKPAFSWTPVAGTTMYDFQLSEGTAFAAPIYATQVANAGVMLPLNVTLEQGKTYFWRVRAILPVQGDWSTIANLTIAMPEPAAPPPVVVTQTPAPVINIPAAPPATTITIPPAPAEKVINPTYIWAIIIIGAVLVIAVIVLIVRTRRTV